MNLRHRSLGFLTLGALLATASLHGGPADTAFTYEAQVQADGKPAEGVFDLRFRLFPTASGGEETALPVTLQGIEIEDGRFAVPVDFGGVFDGRRLYVEAALREAGTQEAFEVLVPRRPLDGPEKAVFSRTSTGAGGAMEGLEIHGQALVSGLVELIESGEVESLDDVATLLQGTVILTDAAVELTDGRRTLALDLSPEAEEPADGQSITAATLTAGHALELVEESGAVRTVDLEALLDTTLHLAERRRFAAPADPGAGLAAALQEHLDELSPLGEAGDGLRPPSFDEIRGEIQGDLEGAASGAAAGNLELADAAGSRGIDVLSSGSSLANGFVERLGWQGSSAPVGTGPASGSSQKVLEIVDRLTSNRFEVDFNRIQPGTIISNLPITINQPGFYYLIHSLTNTTLNGDGIIIDTDNVTLDLGGYALYGGNISGIASDDGIVVLGSQTNITIRNGSVIGWDGDGINALNADFSIFKNLHLQANDGDGLVTDFNCIIYQCTAFSNGIDGLEGDDGTVIIHSTAGQNGDNGIQTSEGCVVAHSASFDNRRDGFDVGAGSVIDTCVATDNGVFGFDVALGGTVHHSTAYDNVSNGFDLASAGNTHQNIASLNSGHGYRTFANTYLRNNRAHENDLDGFRISSTDVLIEDNFATDNDQTGFSVTASGCLFIRNRAAGNLTNYNVHPSCAFGPIVDVTNAGDLFNNTNTSHPQANLAF